MLYVHGHGNKIGDRDMNLIKGVQHSNFCGKYGAASLCLNNIGQDWAFL